MDSTQDGNAVPDDPGSAADSSPQTSDNKEPVVAEEPPQAAASAATPVAAQPVAASVSPIHRGPSPEHVPSQPARIDEDGLEHAQAVASTLVAQLVEDEDQPKTSPSPPMSNLSMDQWFYR